MRRAAWQERSAGLWLVGQQSGRSRTRIIHMAQAKKAQESAQSVETTGALPISIKGPTKAAAVLTLLQRDKGATLSELVEATGWQPHTTRAMLTGLRKKGHAIERRKRDDLTCYHLPLGDA